MAGVSFLRRGRGREAAILVYALYIARFFTGISLLIGVILAYILAGSGGELARAHLSWLIRLFWYDVAFIVGCAILFGACFFVEPPGSSGPGQLLFLLPLGIFAAWNVSLLVALVYGLRALLDGRPPVPDRLRFLTD